MKILFVTMFAAISLFAFGQRDEMKFGPDYVTVIARHCQQYVSDNGVVDIAACNADSKTIYAQETNHNLDTQLAKDWSAFLMSGTSGVPTGGAGNYLALSVSGTVNASDCPASATPATANCNMNGGGSPGTYEISTSGLVRHLATFTRTGNGVYTLGYTWTAGAAQNGSAGTPNGSISSAGVVVGGTAGTGPVLFENTFTPINMAVSDTIQITWTITIT